MGLSEDLLQQPVSQLVIRDVVTVEKNDTVRNAIGLMKSKKLGVIVVTDEQNKPIGKFTEKSLLTLLIKNDKALNEKVGDHLATDWVTVQLTDPISKVLTAMQEKRLRFVVIVDEQGFATGVTGQKGLMEYIADHFPRSIKVQMMESKLYMDQREGA